MSSDHEEDPEVSFHPHLPLPPHPVGQPLPVAGIYMPYIEGPCMDWTVNDYLYHRFLKWYLKCKNILECKLAALPECQQCRKVIAWSGDCGMDHYVSWNLPSNELTLDTIWGKYERILQATIQWSLGQIGFTDEFQTRKLHCGWMVQCHAGTSELGQISPRDSQNTPQGHLLVFSERRRFCVQDHQWWQCQLGQIPYKQSVPIGQKIWKFYCRHIKQVSGEPPSNPNQFLPFLPVLLSCNTSLILGLIHSRTKLDYLPPTARLITSKVDHLRNTKEQIQLQKQVITMQPDQHHSSQCTILPKLITTQSQILQEYPDIFRGIGKFPGPPYHIHVDPGVTPKQPPVDQYPSI